MEKKLPYLTDRWMSFAIVGLVTFVGDCARGILFPALWPLCEKLGGSKVDYGYLVAIFSFGRLVVATPLGILSDRYRHRFALLLSTMVLCLGTILWATAQTLGGLPMLYFAQLVLGLGTGSLGVTRAYVVEQAPPDRRTIMLARLSALQYGGFAGTPLLGSSLVVAGYSLPEQYQYSLPPALVFLLGLLSWGLLIFPFKNIEEMKSVESVRSVSSEEMKAPLLLRESDDSSSSNTNENQDSNTSSTFSLVHVEEDAKQLPSPTKDDSANSSLTSLKQQVFLLMTMLNFTTRGCIAVYETEISRILLDNFNLNQIVLGLAVSGAGILGTIQLVYFKEVWIRHFSDYNLMFGGLVLMACSQALIINWVPNLTQDLWRTILALYCMYSFAYPISNSAVLGSFSKIQKTGKQSTIQSNFALMGSAARILFPILAGYCEGYIGPNSSFNIVLIVAAVSIIYLEYYKRGILYYTIGDLSTVEPEVNIRSLSGSQRVVIALFTIAVVVGIYSLAYDGATSS